MTEKIHRSEEEWRQRLTSEEFGISRKKGTEPPFSGRYADCKKAGVYRCACCGQPLFDSNKKYDSGSGWPSFWAPINEGAIAKAFDGSHGMGRIEVLCSACDAHLGHLFDDGPEPTGLRYCINSASLQLKARE